MQEQSISFGGSWSCGGGEIEAHFRPLFLDSPMRNWRLQRSFKENEQFGVHDFAVGCDKTKTIKTAEGCESACESEIVSNGSTGSPQRLPSSASQSFSGNFTAQSLPSIKNNKNISFPIPTVSFNAVYQLCHIYRHLFNEGIGLRQLLDYYFVLENFTQKCQARLCKNNDQSMGQWDEGMGVSVKSKEEVMHTLSRFGMKKFAGAVMYVLQTVFAMPDVYLLCEADEREGRFLLDEIMQAGNFGKFDGRIKHGGSQLSHAIEKTKHNLRLIGHYPSEVLWEPIFRVYHWLWRKLELWRW